MNPDVSKWPNAVKACAQLGISRSTLERQITSGLLHPLKRHRQGGGRPELVFDPAEIQSRTPAPPVRAAVAIPSIPSPISEPKTSLPSRAMELKELPDQSLPSLAGRSFRLEDIAALVPIIDMVIERKKMGIQKPWLTLDEAAEMVGLPRGLLYSLVKRKKLLAIRYNKGPILVRRDDLKDVDVRSAYYTYTVDTRRSKK